MTMAMAITWALTTPARLATSERSDLLFRPGYYGRDYAYDPASLYGYDYDSVGWQNLNVQTRLYVNGYGYYLGFDHTI